MTTRTTTTTTA